ncbi:MAG: [mycofactocin precursor peptide]-tyrosine decarboxylase, partial [Frankiaceae bacterium]|nr:[mycofactocin precursor peptide]-tyrosine decarboxylase [Frankiaceae bacterium]
MTLLDEGPATPRQMAPVPAKPLTPPRASRRLLDRFELGLQSPICLTWELTYACNLACVHCLSSSGRRDPRELTTDEAKRVVDELAAMQVFYVNIGGGEP